MDKKTCNYLKKTGIKVVKYIAEPQVRREALERALNEKYEIWDFHISKWIEILKMVGVEVVEK